MVPNPRVDRYTGVESLGWVLPIDDTTFRIYVAGKVEAKGELAAKRSRMNGKLWADLTPEEHQRFPGDWEAQVGQGPITFHSDEHLATSDQGVVMLRRLLQRQLDAIAAGRDPAGVSFDPRRRRWCSKPATTSWRETTPKPPSCWTPERRDRWGTDEYGTTAASRSR